MFAHLYRVNLSKAQALGFLEKLQLADKANSRPDKLSGGEKQRLTLALSLVNSPELLILDEPTANLDVQSRHILWDNIRAWHTPERAVILTTHYIEEAEKLANRVGILHEGTLVALDSPQVLINQLNAVASIVVESHLPEQLIGALTTTTTIAANNGHTRIYTRNISSTNIELVQHAERLGIKLGNMHIHYPTLEDVFVSLTSATIPIQQ
jgi:ABC-2 type transport system ATP-binding protein